jgi:hypothetical protein
VFGCSALGQQRRPPRPPERVVTLDEDALLATSTWIVRALPLASACLISLVLFLRTSVIFLRSRRGAVRRAQEVEQALLVRLGQRIVGRLLGTPADCNCSSSAVASRLSCAANWATVVTAMWSIFLQDLGALEWAWIRR